MCWTPTCSSAESMWVKESEKSGWGGGDNAEGESSRHQTLRVCLSTSKCVCEWERERKEENRREIRESLKWDSKDRSAQIDIAITKKAIPQLGIHLHTLESGLLSSHCFSEVGSVAYHTQANHMKRSSLGSHCARANHKEPIYRACCSWYKRKKSIQIPRGECKLPKRKTTSVSS